MSSTFTVAAIAVLSLQLVGCQQQSAPYTKIEPAHLEPIEGTAHSRITLTEKAIERLGVQTTPVTEHRAQGVVDAPAQSAVPYSSIIYLPTGETIVYTSSAPRTFERAAVEVDTILGDLAVLKEGPAVGTEVANIGVAELFGTEIGVGN